MRHWPLVGRLDNTAFQAKEVWQPQQPLTRSPLPTPSFPSFSLTAGRGHWQVVASVKLHSFVHHLDILANILASIAAI